MSNEIAGLFVVIVVSAIVLFSAILTNNHHHRQEVPLRENENYIHSPIVGGVKIPGYPGYICTPEKQTRTK